MENISNLLQGLGNYAREHGVDPVIFITIYIVSFPFYYYPLLKIRKAYKLAKDKEGASFTRLLLFSIIINRLAWASPYLYILIFGEDLPKSILLIIFGYLVLGIIYFVIRIKKEKKGGN